MIAFAAVGWDLPPVLSMLILAVIQGLTEFLPVSSSGHLAVAQHFLGMGDASLVEDVVLHLGTVLAVVFFYRADLLRLVRGVFHSGESGNESRKLLSMLVLANIPSAVVGIGLQDRIEAAFGSLDFVLVAFVLTGALLMATRSVRRGEGKVGWGAAMAMGLAQSLAILPGFSRSGWTIATGLFLGVRPAEAARFSFLMAIPAIGGAALLQLRDAGSSPTSPIVLALGALVAALVGLACLSWLVRLVRDMAFHRFAPYLWALAVGIFALLRLG